MHYVARVGRAALLGIREAFLQVPSQIIPLRKVPHTPAIQTFLFKHMALAQVCEPCCNFIRLEPLRPVVRPPR